MDPVPLCSQCKTRAANWKCRGCNFTVCDDCPEGNLECPLCHLTTTEAGAARPWFMHLPARPVATSAAPTPSSGGSSSSSSRRPAVPSSELARAMCSVANGLQSRQHNASAAEAQVEARAGATGSAQASASSSYQRERAGPPDHSVVVCRLCRAARLRFDPDDPNRWAHRAFCTTKNPPPPLQMDQMSRCMYCRQMIPRDRALDHIMICERVPRDQQDSFNLQLVGSVMRNHPQNYDSEIRSQLRSSIEYCGRTMVAEIGWVCGPVGPLYGLPCANCIRDIVEYNGLPPGDILNGNADFATIGPDGLFECGRNMYRSPNQPNRFADDAALTCSYKDQLICDACMRISCEPIFSYLLPVIERTDSRL